MKVQQPGTNILAIIFVPGSIYMKVKQTGTKIMTIIFVPDSKIR